MKIHQLNEKYNSLVDELNAMSERSLSADEDKLFNDKLEESKTVKNQIRKLEEVAALEKRSIVNVAGDFEKPEEKEQQKMAKRFNLRDAIATAGNLSGVEKEIHDIGVEEYRKAGVTPSKQSIILPSYLFMSKEERATEDTSTYPSVIPNLVDPITYTPPTPTYQALGARTLRLTAGTVKLNFSKGKDAAFYAEGASAAETTETRANAQLSARRVQGWKAYSNEFLAENTQMPQIVADMSGAIGRAISEEAFVVTTSVNELNAAIGALTYTNVLALEGAVEGDNFTQDGYVFDRALYTSLRTRAKDAGSGRFIVEMGAIDGVPAIGSSLQATGAVVYGDWAGGCHVGLWSGIELIVDPYTLADAGETKITFSQLADVKADPYRFASYNGAT